MQSFIARQPIFDRRLRLYGYEMLYRDGPEEFARFDDPDAAAAKVISDCCMLFDTVVASTRAFINVTADTLRRGYVELLPSQSTVIEVLETVEPDEETAQICRCLKAAGYLIALDDYTPGAKHEPLLPLADIVKVDFLAIQPGERRALAAKLRTPGRLLVAEKVEDREAFEEALSAGYDYFQGYFFKRPSLLELRAVSGSGLHCLRILREARQPEPDFNRLEEMVRAEVRISLCLLRYINSAAFGQGRAVTSVRQAVALLGEREFVKLVSVFALVGLGTGKPDELVVSALTRARFCESLARLADLGELADDLFLVGMLSHIDAMLDRPLREVLLELPLGPPVVSALLLEDETGPLQTVYACALAYESGRWEELARETARLNCPEKALPSIYFEAVGWVEQYFRSSLNGRAPV